MRCFIDLADRFVDWLNRLIARLTYIDWDIREPPPDDDPLASPLYTRSKPLSIWD